MPTSNLTGTLPTDWEQAYGGRPVVPSPGTSATQSIQANLGNLGALYGLAGNLNQFNAAQAASQYAANLPDYSSMLSQSSRNIGSMLRGELPADVVSQIMQGAAERGVATGQSSPSPNTNAAMLRALGLTSLGLQQTGEGQLTAAIGRTPTAQLYNPASAFVSPEEWQQAQMGANLYSAAPSPGPAARAAEEAARRGIAAGAGAVGGLPQTGGQRPGLPAAGEQGTYVLPSLGTGTYVGGQLTQPGQDAFTNWNQWYGSLGIGGNQGAPPDTTTFGGSSFYNPFEQYQGGLSFFGDQGGQGTTYMGPNYTDQDFADWESMFYGDTASTGGDYFGGDIWGGDINFEG